MPQKHDEEATLCIYTAYILCKKYYIFPHSTLGLFMLLVLLLINMAEHIWSVFNFKLIMPASIHGHAQTCTDMHWRACVSKCVCVNLNM